MRKRPGVQNHWSPPIQIGISFPSKERILDPKTRAEVVAVLVVSHAVP
jgi:hypothetical protein